jgi:tRNA(fMet)-specific endonuclease VapC
MSVVTYAELMFGVFKSQHVERNLRIVQRIAQEIPVAPLPADAALEYGRLRAHLQKKGQLIGGNDLLIAAHAVYLGLPLVTNNTREFKRVPGLKVENWLT